MPGCQPSFREPTAPPVTRIVKGSLPSRFIEVMSRLEVGEIVMVEDWKTGERRRATCTLNGIPDSQAEFSRVRLD